MEKKQKRKPAEEEEAKPTKRSSSKKAAKVKADDSDEVMADAGTKSEAYDAKNRARVKADGIQNVSLRRADLLGKYFWTPCKSFSNHRPPGWAIY